MQSGRVRKEHYAYEKHGSCALLAAIEPLTGNRLAQVHSQRTKKEFALFFQAKLRIRNFLRMQDSCGSR